MDPPYGLEPGMKFQLEMDSDRSAVQLTVGRAEIVEQVIGSEGGIRWVARLATPLRVLPRLKKYEFVALRVTGSTPPHFIAEIWGLKNALLSGSEKVAPRSLVWFGHVDLLKPR